MGGYSRSRAQWDLKPGTGLGHPSTSFWHKAPANVLRAGEAGPERVVELADVGG
jgi:hypothetical protein